METLNRNKNDDRSIDERAAFNSKYLVIPVIGELTIRYVGHFNFLDTSRLPIYIQITGTFHFWGGTNVDSLRNPLRSTNRYRCFIFGWRCEISLVFHRAASRDNFRKRNTDRLACFQVVVFPRFPSRSRRPPLYLFRIDDPIDGASPRLFGFLGSWIPERIDNILNSRCCAFPTLSFYPVHLRSTTSIREIILFPSAANSRFFPPLPTHFSLIEAKLHMHRDTTRDQTRPEGKELGRSN